MLTQEQISCLNLIALKNKEIDELKKEVNYLKTKLEEKEETIMDLADMLDWYLERED